MHLTPLHACGGRRIVPIVAPGWMVKVDHKITVVRGDRVIENQFADRTPITEDAPLKDRRAVRRAFISHFNVKGDGAFWAGVAFVKNLRHDFVRKSNASP
jgi:hypothetical protein